MAKNINDIPQLPQKTLNNLADSYKDVLLGIGEDPKREGLIKTPMRAAKSMDFLTHGYRQDPKKILESALFHEDYKQIVVVKDIEIYSLCEHHLLPFFGKVNIAYAYEDKVVGLSKLARTVEVFARRLQIQENFTSQIAMAIMNELSPKGVMVVVQAEHMCMSMRGVKNDTSQTVTISALGCFENDLPLQEYVLRNLNL